MQFAKLRNPANANSIDCAILIGIDGIVLLKNYNSGDNFAGTELYATLTYSTSN